MDLATDEENCGECGVDAPIGGLCADGVPGCPLAREVCSGVCVNLSNDEQNCGSCGGSVPAGQDCVDGEPWCDSGLTLCGTVCRDLESDGNHCGDCGQACPEGVCVGAGQGQVTREEPMAGDDVCAEAVLDCTSCVVEWGLGCAPIGFCGAFKLPANCTTTPSYSHGRGGCSRSFSTISCICEF